MAAMKVIADGINRYMSVNQTGENTNSTPKPTNHALRRLTQPAHGQVASTLAEQRGQYAGARREKGPDNPTRERDFMPNTRFQ